MSLSVVIPTFNRLEMTIQSFEQVLRDERVSEVVIVDDKSTDDSFHKLVSFFKDEPKVKVHQNSFNLGCAFNKRRAVELASNPFVIVFDSDNRMDVSYLDTAFDYDWRDDMIFQPEYLMPHFDFRAYSGLLLKKDNIAQWIKQPMMETCLNAHNLFVNRDSYLRVTEGLIDAITSDSIMFSLKWLESGRSIFITPGLSYIHNVHPKSHYQTENFRTPKGLHENILNQLKSLH